MVRSDLYVSPQILQRLVVLAAEALPVLEKQLMDPRGPGDIRVSPRPRPTPGALGVLPLTMEVWSSRGPRQVPSPLTGETEFREGIAAAHGAWQWWSQRKTRALALFRP